jgi:hypothetical protein
LTAFDGLIISRVWPSGAAFTTASVAILVPAPGRFSTTNCWPRRCDSHCAISRATISVEPPAAKPTMTRTGCVG